MTNEKIFSVVLLLTCSFTTLYLFQNHIGSFIIASVLTIATYPLYEFLLSRIRSKILSAVAVLLLMVVLLFVPIGYLVANSLDIKIDTELIQAKLSELIAFLTTLSERFPLVNTKLKEVVSELNIASISKSIFAYIGVITAKSAGFVKEAVFIVAFYFTLLIYGKELSQFILKTLPLCPLNAKKLTDEGTTTIKSLFYSLFVIAFIQGFLFGLMVLFFGLNALYLGIFYGIASMIPIVGGALVWIPVSVFVGLNISISSGVVVAVFSVVVLGTLVDNFARPVIVNWINKKLLNADKSLNEILIFFSMISGIGVFGFFGIILGPTIVAVTITMMKMFHNDEKG